MQATSMPASTDKLRSVLTAC